MRYLRMLTNATLAGGLGTAFVGLIVLQLNPHLPVSAEVVLHLAARLYLFYGGALTLVFFGITVTWQFLRSRAVSPGWLSVRLLAWMSALVVSAAAAIMWANVLGYRAVLDAAASRGMAAGAGATVVSAVLLWVIAIVHYSVGRRGSWVGGGLFAVTAVASLGLPLAARGQAAPTPATRGDEPAAMLSPRVSEGRVFLFAVDGASLEYISEATSSGRFPNFGRMLDRGAAMRLSTIRPTQPAPVWTAVATGKQPLQNGVRSAAAYTFGPEAPRIELLPDYALAHALVRQGLFGEVPLRADQVRAWPVWQVLSRAGIPVGVVGWPVTDPAPRVRGYLVSERLDQFLPTGTGPVGEPMVYPLEAAQMASQVAGLLEPPGDGDSHVAGEDRVLEPWLERAPYARDQWFSAVGRALDERFSPRFIARRYVGPDLAGHYFLRYANPRAFGDVSNAEVSRFGRLLDRHYEWIDTEIGRTMDALGSEDMLLVVSGFGMEPVSLGKRVLAMALRQPNLSGTHERGPTGFLLAYGATVASGSLPLGSIFDIAPTVLYYFGLPLARDMDGFARTDVFSRAFTGTHPLTYVPTYDR